VKEYDVIVGIPSYKEEKTIRHVAEVAGRGLETYFPDKRCVLVNCDNASPDGTRDQFLSADTGIEKIYLTTPEGVVGKGNNFYNLFEFFVKHNAQIGIVVDADLRSIEPDWIQLLGGSVDEGADYVTPLYARHQFDGTITNHLCYPLMLCTTRKNLRQPIGGEFAFSRRLCEHYMAQTWTKNIREYGIDVFMTLNAAMHGFELRQAGLGRKIHNASAPKLGKMFSEVAHTLFLVLSENKSLWFDAVLKQDIKPFWELTPEAIQINGPQKLPEPQELEIDMIAMKQQCRQEFEERAELLGQYLDGVIYQRIKTMVETDHYELDDYDWSTFVFTVFYLFHHAGEAERLDLIELLKPAYFARSLSFNYKTWRYSMQYAEDEVYQQGLTFLSQLPWLYGLFWQKEHNSDRC
jgi:hypothetical protein